jgi:hypothetical protein
LSIERWLLCFVSHSNMFIMNLIDDGCTHWLRYLRLYVIMLETLLKQLQTE